MNIDLYRRGRSGLMDVAHLIMSSTGKLMPKGCVLIDLGRAMHLRGRTIKTRLRWQLRLPVVCLDVST